MTRTKTKKTKTKQRAGIGVSRQARDLFIEADSTYFLKLVVVVVLGTLWLKFKLPITWYSMPFGGFPLGLVIGLAGIRVFEKNPYDRKIWFAVLVIVAIICYFVPAGIVI